MRLLSLAVFAAFLIQAAQSPTQQQRPKATIEGTVSRFGGGPPLQGARVTLSRRGGQTLPAPTIGTPPPSQPLTAGTPSGARGTPTPPIAPMMTDDKGRFSFQADEGIYSVDVEANGYVRQPYGQRYAGGPGLPVTLTSGQTTKEINVSLMPAATVSGRIRDTADQPLVGVTVQLLRYAYDYAGQRTYQPVGSTQTNDRGEYRMFWVTPGRYFLLAGRPTTGLNPLIEVMEASLLGGVTAAGNPAPAPFGFAFYPGVMDIATAQTLDLQPGADVQAIDLALVTKPSTFSIRGKLVDSKTGQAPRRASVLVMTQTPGGNRNSGILGDIPNQNYDAATGTFEIRGLAPGAYTVVAVTQDLLVGPRVGPPQQSSGTLAAAISSSDVEGLVISLAPAAPIAGRLRVEGQLPQPITMDRIRITLFPTAANPMRPPSGTSTSSAQVTADGSFRFENVAPGDYRIEVTGLGLPGRFAGTGFVREARFDGTDVLNNPLRFAGSASGLLEIVLTIGGGQITGTLTDVRSQPVPSTRVVLVPDRLRSRPDLYRTATTDANGRFSLAAVAPGDYRIFAWESMEEFGWFDPDAILRSENRGRGIHVAETSSESADARLIPADGAR